MTEAGGGALGPTRQNTIDALCEHFANDALSVEEFERRVDAAHKAESTTDLTKLLADMPTGDLPAHQGNVTVTSPSTAIDGPKASVPASRVKEKGMMVAALGGVERKGRWIPARQNYAVSVMGGVCLDFREALLPPGETEVFVFTAMGGVEIIVPPGLGVESDGIAILGSFEHREEVVMSPDPDTPFLRIKGLCIMGGVEVSIRLPGETPRDAKRRRRFAKKEQRIAKKEQRKRLKDGS
jgi:hypothetical protein